MGRLVLCSEGYTSKSENDTKAHRNNCDRLDKWDSSGQQTGCEPGGKKCNSACQYKCHDVLQLNFYFTYFFYFSQIDDECTNGSESDGKSIAEYIEGGNSGQ